ncbi:hypothetical protein BGX29_010701 [Mortierella sp. GBA35]|nr:hypothetical protein BGX29_010701 [Mortierella sp. GBA35]
MARTNPPPPLSIKTLFTPSALVCLLALSACTPTSALPISTPHSSTTASFLRDREVEAMARLEREQDELEKAEQDRDQQLDNEEEEQLAQDPETVRRRQEESLGLWMTEAELDAASGTSSASASVRVAVFGRDDAATASSSIQEEETASVVAESKGAKFDLYADDFKEVEASSVEAPVAVVVVPGRIQQLRRLAPEQFTEEEMLQWPIVNQAQFEDRQDEVQDEYEDEQAYPSS